jgi:hypothetical protein
VISVFQRKCFEAERVMASAVTRFWKERMESKWLRSQSRVNRTVSAGESVIPKWPVQGWKSATS